MADGAIADVTAIHRLEDSPLTLEQSRPRIRQSVGAPCSVVQAFYRLRAEAAPMTAAVLDEVKAKLLAKGIRLGQAGMPSRTSPPETAEPYGPAELVVVSSGERLVAPVVECWDLSVPVVIMLLYVRTPVERLGHLVGEQIRIRRVVAGSTEPETAADGGRDSGSS